MEAKNENIHKVKNEDGTTDNYAFVSKDNTKGISIEEAKALQKEIMQNLRETKDFTRKVNEAARLFTSGAFEQAAEVYAWLSKEHPEYEALCIGQIGAAHYFRGNYIEAVGYYKKAYYMGDTDMQEENIFESAEAQFKEMHDDTLLKEYSDMFPHGKFTKEIDKLLSDSK